MEIQGLDIALRLVCAMLAGFAIGAGRERIHRPAGMRTHMVVAVGACVVMITGEMLFVQAADYGAMNAPDRMAAQVISGIGFLGAGTIIREGLTIKGLTTAASLWAVASLGLAAGAGFFALTLGGTAAIAITLYVLRPWQEKHFFQTDDVKVLLRIECVQLNAVMQRLDSLAGEYGAEIRQMEVETKEEDRYVIHVTLHLPGRKKGEGRLAGILENLRQADDRIKLQASLL